MQNTPFKTNPIALGNAVYTNNLLNPGTTTGGTNCTSSPFDKLYLLITHIRIVNTTGGALTVRLYQGATGANAAGSEILKDYSIAANSEYNLYCRQRLGQADFIVGGGSGSGLNIQFEGEVGVGA